MERITLNQTQGRGRNGWFQAREARIETYEVYVALDVVSSRPVIPGPVRLELSPQDASDLAGGLLRVSDKPQPGPPSQGDLPQCDSFADPQAAVAALDTFVETLAASPWLSWGQLRGVREEIKALREIVTLSGRSEAKAIP